MKSTIQFAALVSASLVLLSACGGPSDEPTAATEHTEIRNFVLEGTGPAVNGVTPINAGVNQGQFSMSWDVDSSDPYHLELYLSKDTVIDSGDVNFHGLNCGSVSALYRCSAQGALNCRFGTDNVLSCDGNSLANPPRNLGFWLEALPQDAHLIFQACNALFSDCKTRVMPVRLQ